MGKWDAKADLKTTRIFLICLIIFVVYIIVSQKLRYVSSVFFKDMTVFVGTRLFFYFQYVMSFFTIIISSTMFEETYKQSALFYIRTLPLKAKQIWILRYLRLLILLFIIITPALLIGISQVNYGIDEFITTFDLQMQNTALQVFPILINCFISINFYFLVTQAVMIITKNRIITNSILFAYCIMEAGPWGGFLDTYAIFYGSFSPIPINVQYLSNQTFIIFCSIILEILIVLWYQANFTSKKANY